MKNTVEEASNFRDASVSSGIAARQAMHDYSGNGTEALSSRFTILKQVGESASARFYVARENHTRSADLVNLKVLRRDVVKDPTELVSFLLEARAAARLSHENIIKARGPEQIGSTHFYVVEHKAGAQTLRDLLDQKGWLDIDRAIRLATQIADALVCAHASGILHLEVEPNKVLIGSDDKATLTGFGVDARKQFEWAHRKRSGNCSFAYLSPEQLENGFVDQRSDLYSLGVTLYESLTDRLPFNAENANQIKQKIAAQRAQPPHLLRSDVPEELSSIVTRLISKNPAERFQDAASLKYALAKLLGPVNPQSPALNQSAQKAIQVESDYTHTRELVSEPAPAARSNGAPRSQQPVIASADGGEKKEGEKKEIEQSARFEPPPLPRVAPSRKEIDAAEPKALRDERIPSQHYGPLIKTLDSVGSPLPARLALFTAILVVVIGVSVLAYRNRLSGRVVGQQSTVNPAAAKVEGKDSAPDESSLNKTETEQTSNVRQPNPARRHNKKSGVSNAVTPSMESGATLPPQINNEGPSVAKPRRNNLRKTTRRVAGYRARSAARNIYKRHQGFGGAKSRSFEKSRRRGTGI
jgi:serine/threonine protein kinase